MKGTVGSVHGGPRDALVAALASPSPRPVCDAGVVDRLQRVRRCRVHAAGASDFVTDQARSVAAWSSGPHPSSIEKDISCLLRTYAPSSGGGRRQPFDDLVDCPMRELGLLRSVDSADRRYRFVVGSKSTLPPEIVLYACADFLARTDTGASTVSVSRLATEAGAPGRAFKVSEADLVELLEEAVRLVPGTRASRPAGGCGSAGTRRRSRTSGILSGILVLLRRGMGDGPDARVLAGPIADLPCHEVVGS